MPTEIITTEAIILKSLDFKDYNKIVTLYSKTEGQIKLFVKLSKRTPLTTRSLITPLTKAEFQLSKGKSDFYRFHDGTLLDQRLVLRKSLSKMRTAAAIIEAFCKTQWPEEPNPPLYQLLDAFLSEIGKVEQPKRLLAAFCLKLLKHEGVLQREAHCALCNKELKESYRYKGECYCAKDAPPPAICFSEEEESLLRKIYDLRDFDQLHTDEIVSNKISDLFDQCYIVL